MDSIVVAAKSAQSTSEMAWGNIKLLDTSLVKLPVDPSDVASTARSGNNLIVTLKSGEQVTIGDFFKVDAAGQQSELVFEGQDGFLWQANYGEPFTAAVQKDNFFGVQFHPERSGAAGAQLLKNFLEM